MNRMVGDNNVLLFFNLDEHVIFTLFAVRKDNLFVAIETESFYPFLELQYLVDVQVIRQCND